MITLQEQFDAITIQAYELRTQEKYEEALKLVQPFADQNFIESLCMLGHAIKLNYCVAIKKARKTNMLIGVIEAKNYDGPAYMRNKK